MTPGFPKFTPGNDSDMRSSETLEKLEGAEEFLNLLNKVKEAAAGTKKSAETPAPVQSSVRLFAFEDLDGVIRAATAGNTRCTTEQTPFTKMKTVECSCSRWRSQIIPPQRIQQDLQHAYRIRLPGKSRRFRPCLSGRALCRDHISRRRTKVIHTVVCTKKLRYFRSFS